MSQFFFSLPALHCWIGKYSQCSHDIAWHVETLTSFWKHTDSHRQQPGTVEHIMAWWNHANVVAAKDTIFATFSETNAFIVGAFAEAMAEAACSMASHDATCFSMSRITLKIWQDSLNGTSSADGSKKQEPWTACWTLVGLWMLWQTGQYGGNSNSSPDCFSCVMLQPPWSWTPPKSFRRGHNADTTWTALLIFHHSPWFSLQSFDRDPDQVSFWLNDADSVSETAMIQQSKRRPAHVETLAIWVSGWHDEHLTVGTVGDWQRLTNARVLQESSWKLTKTLGASQFQTIIVHDLSLGIGRSWAKIFLTECRWTMVELVIGLDFTSAWSWPQNGIIYRNEGFTIIL